MKITKSTTLGEVFDKNPEKARELAEIMLNHGLHCVGCHVAYWETIEQGAAGHGMKKKEMEEMIKKLNKEISKK